MTKPVKIVDTSIAVMLGHTAFLLTGMAYLTKDILQLRLLAMSGISASMVFQYYRPQPLLMPLRWNGLFLVINCVMASLLYYDRVEAEDMSQEMLDIYEKGMFEKRGFRKVDFYRLFGIATKEVRKKGDYLKRAGEQTHQLCYIANGAGIISRDQSYLGKLTENDFAGEIEFMRLMTKKETSSGECDEVDNNSKIEHNNIKTIDDSINFTTNQLLQNDNDAVSTNSLSFVANESIIVESDIVTIYTWDFEELKSYLDTHVLVSNALLAYISHELREKLEESWDMKVERDKETAKLEQLTVDYLMAGIEN